jgi:hypothetical protein
MIFNIRGVPVREINGLPYAVHQIGAEQWQIVIENCARYPAGYSFAPVYGSLTEAQNVLQNWPARDTHRRGDDWKDGGSSVYGMDTQGPLQ